MNQEEDDERAGLLALAAASIVVGVATGALGAMFRLALEQGDAWRNYAIVNFCGIPSPILAGYMCKSRWFWGRRGTMIIGALITMVFFFCFTQVRSASQSLGFNCAINFCLVSASFTA